MICETCSHWHREEPAIATATRRIGGNSDVGACQLLAPVLVLLAGIPVTYWPETHASRTCGNWSPDDPTDGDGERDRNVVPLRHAA